MEDKYSAEWVAEQIQERDAKWLDSHDCGLCGQMVGYIIDPERQEIVFRSACGCSWSPDRPSSAHDIANWLAMQSSDDIRDKIMLGLRQ